MSDTEALIERLAADARPVRRLLPPAGRTAVWLGLMGLVAAVLASRADLGALGTRLGTAPDMWLAVLGSVFTTVLAALAALLLAMPDRDNRWAWLPLPGLLLWLGASSVGCLRGDVLAALHPATMADSMGNCLPFIVKTSVVAALPLALLLWRARPLRAGLVFTLGGLAAAAGSASLLWLFHPFDASIADLIVHVLAVGLVVAVGRVAAFLLPDA